MGIGIEDYPDMAADLVRGGFDDAETAAMIRFVGRLYRGQNDVIESLGEDMRAQFDELRKETNQSFISTNARIDRVLYTMIAILGGQLIAIVGTVVAILF